MVNPHYFLFLVGRSHFHPSACTVLLPWKQKRDFLPTNRPNAHPWTHTNSNSCSINTRGSATCLTVCVADLEFITEQRHAVTPPLPPPPPCIALGEKIFSLAQSQRLNPLCNPLLLIHTAAAVWCVCVCRASLQFLSQCRATVCVSVCVFSLFPSSRPVISQSAWQGWGGPSGMWWIL